MTQKLHNNIIMNRYSTHSRQRRCAFFCRRCLVRTISLVAMQPICDDILKSTLSSSLSPSANEPFRFVVKDIESENLNTSNANFLRLDDSANIAKDTYTACVISRV